MAEVPGVPSAEELSALPHAELAARLAEAYRLIGELTAQNEQLAARVDQLERSSRQDSSTSSRPPSSDSPYKKGRDRSLRQRGKRRPGKQPGDPGTTMRLVDDPDETFRYPPPACRGCGADLAGVPVLAQRRHQVTDIEPAPPPRVTEHVAQAKQCPCCGAVSEGEWPAHVRARASFGPETHAQAANLTCGHHIPVWRSTVLLGQLAGIAVSTGWMAGIRGKAAALVEGSGFMDRVRELLKTAPAVHADETPARAGGGTAYVHAACTAYLTHLHTGDRSAAAIDAGGVLPGYTGVIVRDGYAGYGHLAGALHAWCAAHLLRDLKSLYDFEPGKQDWAEQMACLLIDARDAAAAARQAGQSALEPAVLEDLVTRYRKLAAGGLAENLYRRTTTARDAGRVARRFLAFEDLILRFATRPDLDIFTNNEAERTVRPVKVQQRSSGGCWRTLTGLAGFAVVRSYLSTAAKWGISKLDALRDLFNGHAWHRTLWINAIHRGSPARLPVTYAPWHHLPVDSDWDRFISRCQQALGDLVEGRPESFKALWSHADDVVIMGAFGGYERGWEQVSARLDWAATGIKATGRAAENVVTVVGDNLAYTVDLEHMTRHAGDHPTPRTLRCTQAYRRENGEWKVILRHADELPRKDKQQR